MPMRGWMDLCGLRKRVALLRTAFRLRKWIIEEVGRRDSAAGLTCAETLLAPQHTQRKLGHALVEGMLCFADLRVHWHLYAHRLITGAGPIEAGL